jgi:hypothetical protein
MRYFAIQDAAEPGRTTNVFIHNDAPQRADLAVFDRTRRSWVRMARLTRYLFGEESDRARPIGEAEAAGLVAGWGGVLPSRAEVEALPPEASPEAARSL